MSSSGAFDSVCRPALLADQSLVLGNRHHHHLRLAPLRQRHGFNQGCVECRRVGLEPDKVSHQILDDYNKVRVDELYDFERASNPLAPSA